MSKDKKFPNASVQIPVGLVPDKIGNEFHSTAKLAPYESDDTYNPFEHRVIDKPNTTIGALMHLLKSSLGTGILAMPNAIKNSGLLFGSVMTIIVGILCTYCVWILVATSHKICRVSKTPVLGFAETAEKVFELGPMWARKYSRAAKNFVDYALMATYFSAGCVYIVFIGSTFHSIFSTIYGWETNVRVYILIIMIPILFMGQIRSLKFLVPFSGAANVFILVVFGIVLFYIFKEPIVFTDKPLVASWTQWPVFFSTVIFAMEGIGSVMPLENSMEKPQEFLGRPSVLLIAMVAVTILYTVIGVLGYARFGAEIKGSITLNLEATEWYAILGQVLIGLAILFTFGLQFFIPMDILVRKLEERLAKNRNMKEIGLRTIIMVIMGATAIAVPDLEPFIALVGAVFFGSLGLFVPAFIEIIFLQTYEGFGPLKWKLWKNIGLMLFAIIAMFAGAYVSIEDIIHSYTTSSNATESH